MYVAAIPNRNSPPAILLRESFRQDGKVKNRTIANLSRWPPARIDALRRLLKGEPLAVRVFAGNTNDPTTVPDQIRIVKERFGVEELVFVGDRGMVKSKGRQALGEAGLRWITALTDPQIRRRLKEGVLQLELFAEQVCEVEADGVRYVLRLNQAEADKQRRRLEDKLAKLAGKLERRNQKVAASARCEPAAGPCTTTM